MKLSYSSGNLARHTQDFTRDQKTLDEYRWTFQKIDDLKILERVKSEGIPLKEYVNNNVYRGIVTGFNTAFIIDAATRKKLITDDRRSAEIIKPYLAGEDVKRYAINSKKRYIVFTRRGIDIERNPAVKKHLEQFRAELTPKRNNKDTVGRKPGDYKWYEIQDATAYYQELEKPKIVFGELQTSPRFTLDKDGYYINNKLFFFPTEDLHLLGILNSKMCWYLIQRHCTRIMNGFNISWSYFGNIPIPKLKDPQLTKLVARMLELKQRLIALQDKPIDEEKDIKQEIISLDSEIDEIVYKLYGINQEERKIIEESTK